MSTEGQINSVLAYQDRLLKGIDLPDMSGVDERIASSEKLLSALGYDPPKPSEAPQIPRERPYRHGRPTWGELVAEAESEVGSNVELESLFSDEELKENALAVRRLNYEFDQIHRLDNTDIAISAAASLLAGIVDVLMVGIPKRTGSGLRAGPLSNLVRDAFERRYPPERVRELEQVAKVSYDAANNSYTTEWVEGLSSYYHRLLSLGHDPILGLVVGVADIMTGRMTTIDKKGHFCSQVMPAYEGGKGMDLFSAIAMELAHLESDVTSAMGLPVPFMVLFNLMQFGRIGEYQQTVAEIVQGMYYQGYDFIHFCSMSASVMVVEVVVRLAYALRRVRDGARISDVIPTTTNRERMPKLATMLFIAHSGATAINTGKMLFASESSMAIGLGSLLVLDPMAINYPQWIAFAKYSYRQLKWVLMTKPAMREQFVLNAIDAELKEVYGRIDELFDGKPS